MKLIVVMSVEDVKDSILAILQKASVPVLSMVDTKGMKPAVSLAFAASWLGKALNAIIVGSAFLRGSALGST